MKAQNVQHLCSHASWAVSLVRYNALPSRSWHYEYRRCWHHARGSRTRHELYNMFFTKNLTWWFKQRCWGNGSNQIKQHQTTHASNIHWNLRTFSLLLTVLFQGSSFWKKWRTWWISPSLLSFCSSFGPSDVLLKDVSCWRRETGLANGM